VIKVGQPGSSVSGIAYGENGVWVAGWSHLGSTVKRLDPQNGHVTGTARLPYDGADVAAGAGAVWTAGVECTGIHPDDSDVCITEPRVSRIDPGAYRVETTIRIPRPPGMAPDTSFVSGVAVGEGAVWVAVAWDPYTGEVVRIDPSTNAVVARIPTGGFTGELRVAAGSVWVLSHREYTDETDVKGASLLRIDPSRNEIVATPVRDELAFLGGDVIPPVLAVGDDAAWIVSGLGAALRVDTETNRATRERLGVERFYPIAVDGETPWFIGSTGRRFTLGILDPRTLRPTVVTELPIYAVRATFDHSARTFWFASLVNRHNEPPRVVSVELR
jgi:hypothetical protein